MIRSRVVESPGTPITREGVDDDDDDDEDDDDDDALDPLISQDIVS